MSKKMIVIHPSRYVFQHCPQEEGMWEGLLEALSTSGFEGFIQRVWWFQQMHPIDDFVVEFVRNFRVHEGVSCVQGHVISVKEADIARAIGLPPEGLELRSWDVHMKKLEVRGMGESVQIRDKQWFPEKFASVAIVGKRACLSFSVGSKDKIRRYVLALVMQHLSGINSTTCCVQQYLDSVDGLLAGVKTNWPRHVVQRMALVFSRVQKGVSTFVPYASIVAMLLLHQVPVLVKKRETIGCYVQEQGGKVVGNHAYWNGKEGTLKGVRLVGNSCGGDFKKRETSGDSMQGEVRETSGDSRQDGREDVRNACRNETEGQLKNVKIEAGEIESGNRSGHKQGEGHDVKSIDVRTSEITERCLRGRRLCFVCGPFNEKSFKKHRISGENLNGGQDQEQSQTPWRQSKREDHGTQSDCPCRLRASSASQKRKSRSLTELLVDKKIKPAPPENLLQARITRGNEASSSGIKAGSNSCVEPLQIEHLQHVAGANLNVVDGHKQRGDQWKGQQGALLPAKTKLEELESKLSEYLLKMKDSLELIKQKDNQLKEMEVQFILTKAELNSKVEENKRILEELKEAKLELSQKETPWSMFNEKINAIKEELKRLVKEKNMESVEAALHAQNYHNQREDQMKGLQTQLIQLKAEIRNLIDEKDLLSEQLQKAKESLDYHKPMADRLEDLEVQLMLKTHKIKSITEKNKKLSKELKETKDELNRKEVAWKKANEKLVNSIKCAMENDFSEQTTLERARDFEQKPEYITFMEDSFNTLKQQIDNLMDKCVKSFVSEETIKQDCDNDHAFHCSICMEPWTANNEHQICSLACGHYFGRSCIRKWLEQTRQLQSRKCPLCFKKARLRDIRLHYVQ